MGFKQWFLEMGSHLSSDIGNVGLMPSGGAYPELVYQFTANGAEYEVSFIGPNEWRVSVPNQDRTNVSPVTISKTDYTINFERDGSTKLVGDSPNPTAIYGEVFKAIRKLIQERNPESLSFSGANTQQTIIYDTFYRKYLSKSFTRVGSSYYLRNDLYNKYKQENGEQWKAIELGDRRESGILQNRMYQGQLARSAARRQRGRI